MSISINMPVFENDEINHNPLVLKAFELAKKYHEGQYRKTSMSKAPPPYITHCIDVAKVLDELIENPEPELIAAAFLHDTLEDTDLTEEELRAIMGDRVADYVTAVTLPDGLDGHEKQIFQQEAMPLLEEQAQMLKVADRLVNLRNMAYDPPASWNIKLRHSIFLSSQTLFGQTTFESDRFENAKKKILHIYERSLYKAVLDRESGKSKKGRPWSKHHPDIQSMAKRAQEELSMAPHRFHPSGIPLQLHEDLDTLLAEAEEAQLQLTRIATSLADNLGGEAEIPKVKDKQRAQNVVETRMEGDAKRITDLSRASIIVEEMDQIDFIMHALQNCYSIGSVADRFFEPTGSGYRDLNIILQADNGHFCELQVHLKHFYDAKNFGLSYIDPETGEHKKTRAGHDIYCETREVGCALKQLKDAAKEESNDEKLAEIKQEIKIKRKQFDNLTRESRQLYDLAAEMHGLDSLKVTRAKKKENGLDTINPTRHNREGARLERICI